MERKELNEKIKKKNYGITLIALVITIIVLLILAGVSIATLLGENGILNTANDAKQKTDLAKEKENLQFSIATGHSSGLYGELELSYLQDSLNTHFGKNEATVTENPDGTFTVTVKKSGNEYQLTKTGQEINVNKVKDDEPAKLSGSGTEDSPYLIESIEDLIFFSYQVTSGNDNYDGKYVELTTDLNFASSDSYVNPNCEDYGDYGYNGKIKDEIDKNGFIPIGSIKNDTTTPEKQEQYNFKRIF